MSGNYKEDIATGTKVNAKSFFTDTEKSQRLHQLSFIPIILSMLCLLWVKNEKLSSSITALYNEVILYLAKHRFAQSTKDELDIASIQTWVENVLAHVGKIALEGLLEGKLLLKAGDFVLEHLEEACSLGIMMKERKRS